MKTAWDGPKTSGDGPKTSGDAPEEMSTAEARGWALGYNQALIDGEPQNLADQIAELHPENKYWVGIGNSAERFLGLSIGTALVALLFLIWGGSEVHIRILLTSVVVGIVSWLVKEFAEAKS